MKKRKGFVTLAVVGLMAMLLSLPGAALGGGGLPGTGTVPPGTKLIGPMLHGTVFVGWRDTDPDDGERSGTVEAFLLVEAKLYTWIVKDYVPENSILEGHQGFFQMTAAAIPDYPLPLQIAVDYGMDTSCVNCGAVIFEEKDVSNFALHENVQDMGPLNEDLSFEHILHCDVKISFIVPKK